MKTLKINPKFEDFLPPLSEEEFEGLSCDIRQYGCREPIVIWNDTIIDGHHRYRICHENGIEYQTFEMTFDSDNEALLWICRNQGCRRNMSVIDKIEMAMKLKPIFEADAKKRQGTRTDLSDNFQESLPESSKQVRDQLAEQAGVSGRTYDKGVYVLEHADSETLDKLRRGEKGVSISGVYQKLREEPIEAEIVEDDEETPVTTGTALTISEPIPIQPTPDLEPETELNDEKIDKKMFREFLDILSKAEPHVNLRHVSTVRPEILVGAIFSLFSVEFRDHFLATYIRHFIEIAGKEKVEDVIHDAIH